MELRASAAAAAVLLAVAGCSATEPDRRGTPAPAPTSASAAPSGTPTPEPRGPLQPAGAPEALATGLDAPWSAAPLGESVLISQRDAGTVVELHAGALREVGAIEGVVPGGEGGLLGLTVLEEGADRWLYAYFTAAQDNRIVRLPLDGEPGALTLGAPETVLDGLAKAGNHNGGRIAFGPDGMLYATVGDAGVPGLSQDPASLNGKILRMTPEGGVPDGNPLGDSLVWSLGHRNPQGLAWMPDGTMYAAEFGQNTWDELNLIEPGANYGWPAAEGAAGDDRFVDPVQQWSTDEASPSGLAAVGDTLFMAGLGGERLWVVQGAPDAATSLEYFGGELGRIRAAIAAPDGSLWLLTNNTDGRGSPREGDDKLLRVALVPA